MEVLNCENCRRLFQYPGFGAALCPFCKKADDEEFDRVKDYLRSHPGSDRKDIFEATGVDIKKIMRWLKEERLVTMDASGLGLVCEQCGASILCGKLCDACKHRIAVGFGFNRNADSPAAVKDDAPKDNRMRFLDRKHR